MKGDTAGEADTTNRKEADTSEERIKKANTKVLGGKAKSTLLRMVTWWSCVGLQHFWSPSKSVRFRDVSSARSLRKSARVTRKIYCFNG